MSEESNLRDQIENLEDGYESLTYSSMKARKDLIKEFIADLKERDDKLNCIFRLADEPCEQCNN